MVNIMPFHPILQADLRTSIQLDREVGRVACERGGMIALSPLIHNGHANFPWFNARSATVDLGCDLTKGVTVIHTHPHVPQTMMSGADWDTLTRNPWIRDMCVVSRNGISCWPQRR